MKRKRKKKVYKPEMLGGRPKRNQPMHMDPLHQIMGSGPMAMTRRKKGYRSRVEKTAL